MEDVRAFSFEDHVYVPVWIGDDGTEWHDEAVWECCEFGSDRHPYDPYDPNPDPDTGCINPTSYMGDAPDGRHIQLCAEHFEPIKSHSKVRWVRYY